MLRHARPRPGGVRAVRAARAPAALGAVAALGLTLSACSQATVGPAASGDAQDGGSGAADASVPASPDPDPTALPTAPPPETGACRALTPADVARPGNDSPVVDCAQDHTAQTYAVGRLPATLREVAYDDPALGVYAYRTCQRGLQEFLGADESLALRTVLSWAWFRPDEQQWDDGARWYRCDVLAGAGLGEAGPADGGDYLPLPEDAAGLLADRPADRWLVCADGETVDSSPKVACSEPHEWRAVTTIKVGGPDDRYPGERAVEVTTRDFCSDSVGAWLGYPADYEYGYTYFHAAEWAVGNRRSVCWARTTE